MIALIVAAMVGTIGSVGTNSNVTFAKAVTAVNPEAEETSDHGGFCP
jgi:hypothetical protein